MGPTVNSKLVLQERTFNDKPFAVIYLLSLLVLLASTVYINLASNFTVNAEGGLILDDSVEEEFYEICPSLDYCPPYEAYAAAYADPAVVFDEDEGLFGIIFNHAYIVVILLAMTVAVAILWSFALQKLSKVIVFGTFIVYAVFYAYIAFASSALEILVIPVIIIVLLIWKRQALVLASQMISTASSALITSWSAIIAGFLISAVFVIVLLLGVLTFVNGLTNYVAWDARNSCCTLYYTTNLPSVAWYIYTFLLIWTISYLEALRMLSTASAVIAWYFPEDNTFTGNPSLTALKWGVSSSSGVLSILSFLSALADRIKAAGESKLWFFSVFGCVAKICLCVLKRFFQLFQSYAIITHIFTGYNFKDSAYAGLNTIMNDGFQVIVTDYVSHTVLDFSAYVFGVLFGILGLVYYDNELGTSNLGLVFVIFIAIILRFPYLMIILLTLLQAYLTDTGLASLYIGIYVGCVVHIIFSFFSSIVLAAINTCMFSYILDSKYSENTNPILTPLINAIPTSTNGQPVQVVQVAEVQSNAPPVYVEVSKV